MAKVFENILVPYNGTSGSEKAFKKAIEVFTPEEMLIVSNMPLKRYVRELIHFDKDLRHMKFIVENQPLGYEGRKPFNF